MVQAARQLGHDSANDFNQKLLKKMNGWITIYFKNWIFYVLTHELSIISEVFDFFVIWQLKSAQKLMDQRLWITCEKVSSFLGFFFLVSFEFLFKTDNSLLYQLRINPHLNINPFIHKLLVISRLDMFFNIFSSFTSLDDATSYISVFVKRLCSFAHCFLQCE